MVNTLQILEKFTNIPNIRRQTDGIERRIATLGCRVVKLATFLAMRVYTLAVCSLEFKHPYIPLYRKRNNEIPHSVKF